MDGEALFMRAKESYDGALPAGNSVAALNLLRIAHMTGTMTFAAEAEKTLAAFAQTYARGPSAYVQAMIALDFAVGPASEIVIAGERDADDTRALLATLRARFQPNTVVLLRPGGLEPAIVKLAPYTLEQKRVEGRAAAYVCRDFACREPVTDAAALGALLDGQ